MKKLPPQNFVLGLARKNQTHPKRLSSFVAAHSIRVCCIPRIPFASAAPAPQIPSPTNKSESAGRRKVLADWMTSKDNWFTARVIVNRLWQHHFGRGIVRSSNNFGQLGDTPTHPALLDWLATRLMENDCNSKPSIAKSSVECVSNEQPRPRTTDCTRSRQ